MLTNTTLVYFLEKESYLLSVSQKSNKLKKKKTNTIVPRSQKDSQRIKRKKKIGTNSQRSPSSISCSKQNQLQGQVRLLRALSDSVLKNFQDQKLQNLSGHTFQCFFTLAMKNFFAHIQLLLPLLQSDSASHPLYSQ